MSSQQEFFVVPVTHVDLAWKCGPAEMSEMLEIVVVRLLDALEHDPDFKYLVEQAAHFRELARRRPDLVARLRPFIEAGRVEVVGGMASTLECNLPNGECFVRNQQIGLAWVREHWGVEVRTGWLVDTFGVNAQVPQLLRGFGIGQLMASRFGGSHTRDLFTARGLDGSEITVAGWGSYAAYVRPENVAWQFYKTWDDVERCFAKADALTGPGPFLVLPYTENEMLVSLRPLALLRERNRDVAGQVWRAGVPRDFFAALERTGRTLPVVDGDLNPEFTGCFSLRHSIRLRNREVENRLLEAEKWAALAGLDAAAGTLEEAWWRMAYVQFHDVFTGSHPTWIFRDVMNVLGEVEAAAAGVLDGAFARLAPPGGEPAPQHGVQAVVAFNGLPWERRDVLEVPLPSGWEGVRCVTDSGGAACPFEVRGETVRVLAETPPVGFESFALEAGPARSEAWEEVRAATLENEWLRLDFDRAAGVAKLVWKPTGVALLENAGSWLVAQRDDGNFQIENPAGPEVAASSGSLKIEQLAPSPLGQTVRLSGAFPPLSWAGPDNFLRWRAEFSLVADRPEVRLALEVDWKGEATRVRLTLPTTLDTGTGIYEIPFGVVRRKPYSPRANAKGEWPAHRFVALEDNGHGVALVNTGVGGVEVGGGTLYTTLLRAPRGEYAGMVADETSSQHGRHAFRFALLPYAGSWAGAGVASRAQELNSPLLPFACGTGVRSAESETRSFLRLEPANVVLSSVKAAPDGPGQLIVRVYETAGRDAEAVLQMPSARRAWPCDLREAAPAAGDAGNAFTGGEMRFMIAPFEIKTFRIDRAPVGDSR